MQTRKFLANLRLTSFQTISAGTYTVYIPQRMRVHITASAGGGGCGHHPSTTNSHSGVGMGGSGAGFRGELVLPRGTLTIVVGAGGTHLFGGYPTGAAGGDTKITFADGTYILLTGGKGGYGAQGGGTGGAGGTASTTRSDCPAGSLINGTTGTVQSYCDGVTKYGQPNVFSDGTLIDVNVNVHGGSGKVTLTARGGTSVIAPAAGSFFIKQV